MKCLLRNARIYDGTHEDFDQSSEQCMLINGETIEYIGPSSHPTAVAAIDEGTISHDLQNRAISPGFIDGHMHLLHYGLSLKKVGLEKCKNLEDIRATIKEAAQKDKSKPRILCRGWMHPMTNGEAFASAIDDLDERPIFIESKDLHSTWCNSAALRELNIQDTPNPAGGEIHRDEKGNPTGLLSESAAFTIVWPHVAKSASLNDRKEAIREAVKAYNAAGYTGIIEMAMDENAWQTLQELRKEQELTIRIAAHWLITPSKTDEENLAQVDQAIALHKKFNIDTSPNFRIAGIKVIGDGIIDGCTAALLEPYTSNGYSCDPLWDSSMLQKVVQKADAAGLQCALHAIGDAAIKLAITTLDKVGSRGQRHRIEHLELTSPGDAKRLSDLGITASIQAVHCDPVILRAWHKLLGEDRCKRAFAYREFSDEGVNISMGTDAPTAPSAPLANLYVATTRRSAREPSSTETFNPQFALSFLKAMSAATLGSAYSCFADKLTGKLEAGKRADFVVIDMKGTPETLLEARVLQTWFEGKKVFDVTQTGLI